MLPQTQTRDIAREEAELTVAEIRANLALADSLRRDAKLLKRTLPRLAPDCAGLSGGCAVNTYADFDRLIEAFNRANEAMKAQHEAMLQSLRDTRAEIAKIMEKPL